MKNLNLYLIPFLSCFIIIFSSFNLPLVKADTITNQEKEVIVVYKNENGKEDIVEEIKKIEYEFQTVPAVSVLATEEELKNLESNSNIDYIEENIPFTITETGPLTILQSAQIASTGETQWNIKETNVQKLWNEGYSGDGVKVAVLDTGIANHHELAIAGGFSTVDYTNSWQDDHGHGTHIAGIISAKPDIASVNGWDITGVSPDVDLYAVKVLDNSGLGNLQDILEGIDWAIANGIDIINLSIGTPNYSRLFEQIIHDAYEQGILLVAASGNDGLENSVQYPAKFNDVIATSSVNESLLLSDFSSTGNQVDFSAPGEKIISTFTEGKYAMKSGTSQATPHVTGMLALLKQKYPNLTNSELKTLLTKHIKDLGVVGQDPFYGYGLIYFNTNINAVTKPSISYSTHVQDIGWMNPVSSGVISGTVGQAKRLESIKISLATIQDLGVKYSTHVQDYGWLDYVSNGEASGTTGKAKRLEAIKIELTGAKAENYDIYYRVHVQDYGWLNWVKNGELAGTTGESKRLESIEIVISEKQIAPPTTNVPNQPVLNPSVTYKTHVQNKGWLDIVSDGVLSGTVGQALRIEAIQIFLENAPYAGGISYKTHVENYGWLNDMSDGGTSGTTGESKRVEAIQINLTGEMTNHYDVYYRVHSQSYGWLGWAKNGEPSGTEGLAKRIEAIQIVIVTKEGEPPSSVEKPFLKKSF